MQTRILQHYLNTPEGREADAILRACVHCGFCTATCPTYQLLGDELDGPRGRIYQIKQVLEGHTPSRITQGHLDRCLTCRSCETTCPSGVRYGRLADIGRHLVEEQVERPLKERLLRSALVALVPYPKRFGALAALGRLARPLLPSRLAAKVPSPRPAGAWPSPRGRERVLVLAGCVQSVATPLTNAAAARVLDRLGLDLVTAPKAGCCGAAAYHLTAQSEGLDAARCNIDALWPEIELGCLAILVTASGCGVMVKDYGELLKHDPGYADKAARVSALARDPAELLCPGLGPGPGPGRAPVRPGPGPTGPARAGQAHRLPSTLHPAARPEDHGRHRAHPDPARVLPDTGARRPSVLRLRRHLFDHPAQALDAASRQQGVGPGVGRARAHRHRQHRLPAPSGVGQRGTGGPLAGASGFLIRERRTPGKVPRLATWHLYGTGHD
ncbi:MAG: glycolate oxidase iron-sulfur subunit [Chromatiaceae bacterium]|nr:glycolate oxidase iron-sulfur subunit [Chromatiaceae bacterium]